jgi:nicotinamidase-related amidase
LRQENQSREIATNISPNQIKRRNAIVTIEPMRDPATDHLLTPQNSALTIIDYQPLQVTSVASMDRRELVLNITSVTRLAKLFRLPIVLSTVNVKAKGSQPTIHQLRELLPDVPELDRTTINAWEDQQFLRAVKARVARS